MLAATSGRVYKRSMPPPVPPPLPTQKWWQIHWKWLAGLGGAALLCLFLGVSMVSMRWLTGRLKGSEPYRLAMEAAQSDSAVTAELGTPITQQGMVTGAFNEGNGFGNVVLTIPVNGPKAQGTIHVVAQRHGERWHFSVLQLSVEKSGRKIDLPIAKPAPK